MIFSFIILGTILFGVGAGVEYIQSRFTNENSNTPKYSPRESNNAPEYHQDGRVKLRNAREASGIIFGKLGSLLACSPEAEEGHCAVFGGTGLGKTLALLVPTLRCWLGTAFVIDLAGDVCKNVDMPNKLVYEPENPCSAPYNIFAETDELDEDDEQNEHLATLAHLIMPEERKDNSTTTFFKTEGRKMLIASLICYYHDGLDFIDICKKIIESSWETLLADIAEHNNDKASQFITSFIGTKGENTAGCKQALDKAINLFAFSENLKNNIRRPNLGEQHYSPDMLEETNVFVILDEAKLKVYAPLLHIITAQTLNYMSKRANYRGKTILFCLDEFATYGKLDLTDALRKLRKKRIRIMILTQSLADIDLIYGWNERKVMMDNFALLALLGCEDPDTQEFFSKKIGEVTVMKTRVSRTERPTRTTKPSQYGDGEFTVYGSEITVTEHEYEDTERIVPPAELARLGDALILLYPDGHLRLTMNFPPRGTIL